MLNNIKKQSGFTIVELLIVIVVIAILAAISIVAYNGIQNRGKASAEQSLASQIAKKAEAFNTIESSYPASASGFGDGTGTTGNPKEAKLDDPTAVVAYTAGSGSGGVDNAGTYISGSQNRVVYRPRTGGACVFWWDYSAGSKKIITAGAATATGTTAGVSCEATT
ncbi:MAG TPA: prepilin-type N-terminal cleavage/methylation domain-containing protein [Candidatus Saccharimonadales bacterium]